MTDQLREELAAYLDGELEPAQTRDVEDRLKHDPLARAELRRLESAWDMLDHLDRVEVGEKFTKTTLEMVAVAAAHEAPAAWGQWRSTGTALVTMGLLTAGLFGYACGRWVWTDPNLQLLQDLPIIENTALYDQGGTIEFVRKLERSGVFDAGTDQPAATGEPDDDDDDLLALRRAAIEKMTPLERQHLRHDQEHFARYSAEEQARMRHLYADIEHDPHDDELRRVLTRYHEWLGTQVMSVREELVELPVDERVAKIKEIKLAEDLKRKQELESAQGPTAQDLQAIVDWVGEMAWRHRAQLLGSLGTGRRSFLEGQPEANQRKVLLWMQATRFRPSGKGAQVPGLLDEGIAEAAEHLSPGARQLLSVQSSPIDKQKLFGSWLRLAMQHNIESTGIRKLLPIIRPQELQRFSEDELSEEQRAWLHQWPQFEQQRLLLWAYLLPHKAIAQLKSGQWPGVHPGAEAAPGTRRHNRQTPKNKNA